jgi:hypothetical protein
MMVMREFYTSLMFVFARTLLDVNLLDESVSVNEIEILNGALM